MNKMLTLQNLLEHFEAIGEILELCEMKDNISDVGLSETLQRLTDNPEKRRELWRALAKLRTTTNVISDASILFGNVNEKII